MKNVKKNFFVFALLFCFSLTALAAPLNYIPVPDQFDYRDFQNQNWLTLAKNQSYPRSCGSCWAHAAVGSVEGFVNLYYNQHLDLNLSEQQLVSIGGNCCSSCGNCSGGYPDRALMFIDVNGIVDEACFPYIGNNSSCSLCGDWNSRVWRVSNNADSFTQTEIVKSKLVEKGTMAMIIWSMNHAVTLTGYDEISGGLVLNFKNSYGPTWGENGFGSIAVEGQTFTFGPTLNFVALSPKPYEIVCTDLDNDGYCFWGISLNKPSVGCPSSCAGNNFSDFNDFNPSINKVLDLWISQYNIPDHFNLTANNQMNLALTVGFKGNAVVNSVSNVDVKLYIDNVFYQTKTILSMNDGGTSYLNFSVPVSYFLSLSEPYYFHEIRFEVVPKAGEIWFSDNNFSKSVWFNNFDSGFVINQNGYVFDCATNQNPVGGPIGFLIGPGPQSYSNGIVVNNVGKVVIKNCVLVGWMKGIVLNNSNGSEILNNVVKSVGVSGIELSFSDNVLVSNNFSGFSVWDGFFFTKSSDLIVSGNTAEENGRHGFYAINDAGLVFNENNNAFGNRGEGFYFKNSSGELTGNISGSNSIGFYASSDSSSVNIVLNNNDFCDNIIYDLYCGSNAVMSGSGNFMWSSQVAHCSNGWPVFGVNFQSCDNRVICSDGTRAGYCAAENMPFYCDDLGELIENCEVCGCPESGQSCLIDGNCAFVCSDGTISGNCANFLQDGIVQPTGQICVNGELINDCKDCGCPQRTSCQANGTCKGSSKKPPVQSIEPILP